MKKIYPFLVLTALLALFSACQPAAPVCPPGTLTYHAGPTLQGTGAPSTGPSQVTMGGTTLQVDQVLHGDLCDHSLRGTVYVACDIQVNEWADKPLFLDGCNFTVAPGTVIYVAAHNNAAYYNGCAACHASSKAP